MSRFLVILAALMGAAGVALAAAGAHAAGGANYAAGAQMLLTHSPAVLAIGLYAAGRPTSRLMDLGATMLAAGAALFAADLALRAYAGHPLFPMAAPTGGMVAILGWLVLAASGLQRHLNRAP